MFEELVEVDGRQVPRFQFLQAAEDHPR
jgi:hypothetical protein